MGTKGHKYEKRKSNLWGSDKSFSIISVLRGILRKDIKECIRPIAYALMLGVTTNNIYKDTRFKYKFLVSLVVSALPRCLGINR